MLTPSRFAVMARLYEEVENAVSSVVSMHNALLKEALNKLEGKNPTLRMFTYYREWMMHEGTIEGIDSFGVDMSWSESAKGCRTGGGRERIHYEAICDSTRRAFLEEKVSNHIAAIRKTMDELETRNLARKRADLERLKKELGES
jgi:hypothetical protein